MFGFSLSELGLVVLVAFLLISPKDIPVLVRTLAKWGRALKGLSAEFKQTIDGVIQQTELQETKREIEQAAHYIIDDEGRRQRVYDITDLVEKKPPADILPPHE